MKELGEYLKHSRLKSGLNSVEVCEDLGFTASQLENIESGNVKAFKDIYVLRELIGKYSNYLGLETDKVFEQFNDYLYEKTSKISLDDIKNAQKTVISTNESKVKSPYTKEYKEKKDIRPIFFVILGIVVLFLVLYIVFMNINKKPNVTDELIVVGEKEMFNYEFTN